MITSVDWSLRTSTSKSMRLEVSSPSVMISSARLLYFLLPSFSKWSTEMLVAS